MTSCYWGSSSSVLDRHDPSLPYLEQYRIDPVQFSQLYAALAPWTCGGHTPTLSARLFRLLDQNQDGLVNFKEFITGLSGMYHGDMTEKLKLLYKLHLPPALCPEEAESALEATNFFTEDQATESSLLSGLDSLMQPEVTSGEEGKDEAGDVEEKKEVKDYRYYLRMWAREKEPRAETIKDLQRMNQEQFIELCKTLYNMFSEEPLEQELYHSIATVASLLLRIGEVGKRFNNGGKRAEPGAQAPPPAAEPQGAETGAQAPPPAAEPQGAEPAEGGSDEETKDDTSASSYSVVSSGSLQCEDIADDTVLVGGGERRRGSALDADWSITFEQVLASLLTEPPLVDFFERKRDIQAKMAACKAQRAVERQISSASDHEPPQHAP